MVSQAELISKDYHSLVLSQFFTDGMGPFNIVTNIDKEYTPRVFCPSENVLFFLFLPEVRF